MAKKKQKTKKSIANEAWQMAHIRINTTIFAAAAAGPLFNS